MKGARINFGVPNSEYVLLTDDDGVAVSLKNQDTGTEYVGGGGSDFLKLTATLKSTNGNAEFFGYLLSGEPFVNAFIIKEEDGVYPINFVDIFLDSSSPLDVEIYYMANTYCYLSLDGASSASDYVVTGDAEVIEDDGAFVVKMWGNCSITVA